MEKNLRGFELGIYTNTLTNALTNLTCKPVKENIGIYKKMFYYFILFPIIFYTVYIYIYTIYIE